MDVEFADSTYTVKELKAKIARIGLKLPAKGSGKDGRLVKKDYEKILKMYKNKAVLELIKESKGADSNRTTAIILLKTPYAIGFVVALFLHLLLPEDKEEEEEEDSGKEMKVDPVEA